MRWTLVANAIVIVVLFQGRLAFADPIATWTSPWVPTLGLQVHTVGDDETAKRAFGLDAKNDGDITNVGRPFEPLPATQARALAFADVSADGCLIACNSFFANTSINVLRTFRLEDSPSGSWAVELLGLLSGQIQAGGSGSPRAIAFASLAIAPSSSPVTSLLSIEFPDHDVTHENRLVHDLLFDRGFLRDGAYLVQGTLFVQAEVDEQRALESGFCHGTGKR